MNAEPRQHYVYVLRCADNSLYTGWTTHLEERIDTHNSGKGAKYTRSRRPVTLLYSESYSEKSEALKREAEIKKMSRLKKEELIQKAPECKEKLR
ncbi:MAG: GIY-YIG nuclease family protein [Ruminococcaceae bacterium]|nr:GIY-YIG nuclease family protein [Oscillospiraceae bacterium]